jgi:hypothetical protein
MHYFDFCQFFDGYQQLIPKREAAILLPLAVFEDAEVI